MLYIFFWCFGSKTKFLNERKRVLAHLQKCYRMLCYMLCYSFSSSYSHHSGCEVVIFFISISLMTNDGEHIFMRLLTICIISGIETNASAWENIDYNEYSFIRLCPMVFTWSSTILLELVIIALCSLVPKVHLWLDLKQAIFSLCKVVQPLF